MGKPRKTKQIGKRDARRVPIHVGYNKSMIIGWVEIDIPSLKGEGIVLKPLWEGNRLISMAKITINEPTPKPKPEPKPEKEKKVKTPKAMVMPVHPPISIPAIHTFTTASATKTPITFPSLPVPSGDNNPVDTNDGSGGLSLGSGLSEELEEELRLLYRTGIVGLGDMSDTTTTTTPLKGNGPSDDYLTGDEAQIV